MRFPPSGEPGRSDPESLDSRRNSRIWSGRRPATRPSPAWRSCGVMTRIHRRSDQRGGRSRAVARLPARGSVPGGGPRSRRAAYSGRVLRSRYRPRTRRGRARAAERTRSACLRDRRGGRRSLRLRDPCGRSRAGRDAAPAGTRAAVRPWRRRVRWIVPERCRPALRADALPATVPCRWPLPTWRRRAAR